MAAEEEFEVSDQIKETVDAAVECQIAVIVAAEGNVDEENAAKENVEEVTVVMEIDEEKVVIYFAAEDVKEMVAYQEIGLMLSADSTVLVVVAAVAVDAEDVVAYIIVVVIAALAAQISFVEETAVLSDFVTEYAFGTEHPDYLKETANAEVATKLAALLAEAKFAEQATVENEFGVVSVMSEQLAVINVVVKEAVVESAVIEVLDVAAVLTEPTEQAKAQYVHVTAVVVAIASIFEPA